MPSYRGPLPDETPDHSQPRRNLFGTTNSRFAGETPFRSGSASSSDLFPPAPVRTRPKGRGLLGSCADGQGQGQGQGEEQEHEPEQERDQDEMNEDEDGEYEVDETLIVRKAVGSPGPFPSSRRSDDPHRYSSPTDGDDEESPYAHGTEGEEEEDGDEEGDDEYDEEDTSGDYAEATEEDEPMQDSAEATPQRPHKSPARGKLKKSPTSTKKFLQQNPPSLIKRSNALLRSLVNILVPPVVPEEPLPEASPVHRLDVLPAGKKLGYLSKHVSLFLSHLEHVSLLSQDQGVSKAYYLSSLLLLLHHPSSQPMVNKGAVTLPSPIEIFKSFLQKHHPNPTKADLQALHAYHPTPCASPHYWDVLAHLTLRGELTEVQSLLGRSGWDNIVLRPTGEEYKYTEEEVDVLARVITDACKLIVAAPQLFVKGRAEHERFADWRIYRGRVHAAIEDLKMLSHNAMPAPEAEGDEGKAEYRYEDVCTTRRGFTNHTKQRTKVVKPKPRIMQMRGDDKPFTKVPKDIEAGLMNLYQILVGKIDGILSVAERWEEAVLGASIWRRYIDEEDLEEEAMEDDNGNTPQSILNRLCATSALRANATRTANSQRGFGKRQSTRTYNEIETLKASFNRITAKDSPLDTTNPLEVGTGHILRGDWKALVDLIVSPEEGMAAFSVAGFIVEVAKLAQWGTADCEDFSADKDIGVSLLSGFRNEGWSVFSKMGNNSDDEKERGRKERKWEEKLMEGYVRCLVKAGSLSESGGDGMELDVDDALDDQQVEGWEISMEALQRWAILSLDSADWSKKVAGEILSSLPLTSSKKVEKILMHCKAYSLTDTYISVSASYAGYLYANSHLGSSLLYFSRAANKTKIHSIVTRLCSQSLLLSSAYPPWDKLDPIFKELLERPSGEEDDILRFELSGYATLRLFYDARDEGKKDIAARAIVALMRSAGEMVDGGRAIDEEWGSAVEWWMGGVLIGEALAFLNQNKRQFAIREIFDILKVIQDLTSAISITYPTNSNKLPIQTHSTALSQNTSAPVNHQAEKFLRKCLLAYKSPSDIPRLLKKSTSSSLSSMVSSGMLSSWQHLGDEDHDEDNEDNEDDDDGFAIVDVKELGQVPRGWDWRARMVHALDREKVKGGVLETVVRVARMGFARELAKAWLDGQGELGVQDVGQQVGATGEMAAVPGSVGMGIDMEIDERGFVL